MSCLPRHLISLLHESGLERSAEISQSAPLANYQAEFQQRWPTLSNPHVRNLAWIVDAPALLNVQHPHWQQKVAQMSVPREALNGWLLALDEIPEALIRFLEVHPQTRLGHYAENLLSYYFRWCGVLIGNGIQVRAQTTLGEFDFLLSTDAGMEHWEFACKFYLFIEPRTSLSNYVGPNLLDNLDKKTQKIWHSQLQLGRLPEAQNYLPQPLVSAKALLKGWLFYPSRNTPALAEIANHHCRGLWCRLADLQHYKSGLFTILSRLNWLAPASVGVQDVVELAVLSLHLQHQFRLDTRPVLVAQVQQVGDRFIEFERIFIVPDHWNCQ